MATWQRIGVGLKYTIGLAIGGVLYQQMFIEALLPLVEQGGLFSQPVFIMERVVPAVMLIILVAVWAWVVAGAVQDERSVNRRVRR